MAEEVKSLLDAVSAGINEADTKPAAPEPKEEPADGNESSEVSGEADDGGAGEEGAGAAADGEVSGEAGAEPKTGADGKDGAAAGGEGKAGADGKKAGKDGEAAAEAAAAEAAKGAAARKVDPVNDPFDKRWKETTTARVQSLIDITKRQGAELEQANVLFDSIQSTGMQPEQLAAMLGYARARNHGTAEQKKHAYTFLKDELRALALEIGETDVVDFTAEHPDLQEAVTNNQLTAELAREIAISRSRGKRDTENTAATEATTQAQREHAAGVNALGAMGSALAKQDGEAIFLAKKATLVATLKPVFAQIHPSKWAATFKAAYDALPKPAPVVAPVVPPKQQPLRSGTPAGGSGKKEAKSLFDAVSAAVDGDAE